MKDDNNVAGNNVAGNSNVTGNNNQTAPTAIAPNGIAIAGGTVQNPTVNNYTAPSSRRFSDEQKGEFTSCLKKKAGTFTVGAGTPNREVSRYAQDFSEALSGAGWVNEQDVPVAGMIMINAGCTGVLIGVPGRWDKAANHAVLVEGSPEEVIVPCLNEARIAATPILHDDMKTGSIRVIVCENPSP